MRNIEVIDKQGDLKQTVYVFWISSKLTVLLADVIIQSRSTKRHKWTTNKKWNRLFGRSSNMPKPELPEAIKSAALSVAREQIKMGE